MTSGNPALDKYLTSRIGQTANPYPGPVSAQINPMMTNAANIMSMYATGQPYQAPGYNTYQTFMPQMGQQQQQQRQYPALQPGAGAAFDPMAFINQYLGGGQRQR